MLLITVVPADTTIEVHGSYTAPVVTVTDNYDTGLTASVSGTVDVDVLGDYVLTYTARDTVGNTSLPVGTPSAGIPFNPGEVFAYRTFSATVGTTPEIVTVPFEMDLSPGIYGVVFGSGLYGTSGFSGSNGGTSMRNRVAGSSSFFWSSEPWRWQDTRFFPNQEFKILMTVVVPEPSSAVLTALGLSGLLCLSRVRRQ